MKRYFKWQDKLDDGEETDYFEYDSEDPSRAVNIRNGVWTWTTWEDNPFAFADQPLSSTDLGPEKEISREQFEGLWEEAQKRGISPDLDFPVRE